MPTGLSVSRLVNVQVNLAPLAAASRNFGSLLILGDSNVINGVERIREYTDIDGVVQDFGTTAPEYLAAVLFYEQAPQPQNLSIGRWLRTASAGLLDGALLTDAQQAISNWTVITTGAFKITIDGVLKSLTALNFSTATNMNSVATLIQAALTGGTIVWDGEKFVVTSSTTGTASSVTFAIPPSSGTDISTLLGLSAATASNPVPGFAAETALAAVAVFTNLTGDWYGLNWASSVMPVIADYLAVAAFIQAQTVSRIQGVTTTDSRTLDSTYTTDVASQLTAAGYTRSCVQYSSSNPYAVTSLFGRAFSVDFQANRSTITLMYKQEPGIVPETLTETQAQALETKRCNVFVKYQNNTAIIQDGVMSGPAFFDEIHGLDWLANELQTEVYNLLYQTPTKIPQTDDGLNQIVNVCSQVMNEAINNGLVAPGEWNAPGFGQLQNGQYLKTGFYIYAPPMATQPQQQREQRIAPPIQIAAKLAGAIHFVNATINVNR